MQKATARHSCRILRIRDIYSLHLVFTHQHSTNFYNRFAEVIHDPNYLKLKIQYN